MNLVGWVIAVGGGLIILMLYELIGDPILIAAFALLLSILLGLGIMYLIFRRRTSYGTRRFKTRITIWDTYTGFHISVQTWPKPKKDEKMSQALEFSARVIKHVHAERRKIEKKLGEGQ